MREENKSKIRRTTLEIGITTIEKITQMLQGAMLTHRADMNAILKKDAATSIKIPLVATVSEGKRMGSHVVKVSIKLTPASIADNFTDDVDETQVSIFPANGTTPAAITTE